MGFPLLTCPGIRSHVSRWDALRVDWSAHTVVNDSRSGLTLPFEPLPSADRGMLESGGFIPYLKARLAQPEKRAPQPDRSSGAPH